MFQRRAMRDLQATSGCWQGGARWVGKMGGLQKAVASRAPIIWSFLGTAVSHSQVCGADHHGHHLPVQVLLPVDAVRGRHDLCRL